MAAAPTSPAPVALAVMDAKASNLDQLSELLVNATQNPNPDVRKPAEAKLKALADVPGFHSCLIAITHTPTIQASTRLAAVIHLKNNMKKFLSIAILQSTGATKMIEIREAEKKAVKAKLLEAATFTEPDKQVAEMTAAAIGVAAMAEWPKNWAELFPALFAVVKTVNNPGVVNRGLFVLAEVLAELGSSKFLFGKQQFQQAAISLVGFVRQMWTQHMEALLKLFQAGAKISPEILKSMNETAETVQLYMRCLHRIMVVIPLPHENTDTKEFFAAVLNLMPGLFKYRAMIPSTQLLHGKISSIIELMASVPLEVLRAYPLPFRLFVVRYFDLFVSILKGSFSAKGELVFEELSIIALNFIAAVLSTRQYTGSSAGSSIQFDAKTGITAETAARAEAKAAVDKHLQPALIKELTVLLVSRFLILRTHDFQEWASDPEQYVKEEKAADAHQDRVRPAAANVFGLLLNLFPQVLGPAVGEMLAAVLKGGPTVQPPAAPAATPASPPQAGATAAAPAPDPAHALLLKEAVYHAVGLGSHTLYETFVSKGLKFESWLSDVLAKELSTQHKALAPLRRRVVWLVGAWCTHVPANYRKPVYQMLTVLLEEKNDLVIRLYAAEAVEKLMNDVDSIGPAGQDPAIVDCVGALCTNLFSVLDNVKELEQRRNLLGVIRTVMEKAQSHLKTFLPLVVKSMSKLWDSAGKTNLLRQEILYTLLCIVEKLGPESVALQPVIVPILTYSLDVKDPDRSFLYDSALDLWKATAKNTPALSPAMAGLFPNWFAIINYSTSHLENAWSIMTSYAMVGRGDFFKAYGAQVAALTAGLMGHNTQKELKVNDEGLYMISRSLEVLAQLIPKEFPQLFKSTVLMWLKHMTESRAESERQAKLDADVKASGAPFGRKTKYVPPPNVVRDVTIAGYFKVLSRLFFQNPDGVMALFAEIQPGKTIELLCLVLDCWVEKYDLIPEVYNKKLSCLGMLNAVCVKNEEVLKRFLSASLNAVLTALVDLEDSETLTIAQRTIKGNVEAVNNGEFAPPPTAATATAPASPAAAVLFPEVAKVPLQLQTEVHRLQILVNSDAAYPINLRAHTMGKLGQLQQLLGAQTFAKLMGTIDPATIEQLKTPLALATPIKQRIAHSGSTGTAADGTREADDFSLASPSQK